MPCSGSFGIQGISRHGIEPQCWDIPSPASEELTHWGRVTHICVSKLTIIGSDNGLSPGRRQAIIWTNAEILLIGPLGTNFSEILIGIQKFPFKKMHLKMSSAKWRPFSLGLNVLTSVAATVHFCIQCSFINLYNYGICRLIIVFSMPNQYHTLYHISFLLQYVTRCALLISMGSTITSDCVSWIG